MSGSRYHELVEETITEGIWRTLRDGPERRAPSRDVEITAVNRSVVDGNFPWNLVTVETDEGVYGLGEACSGPVGEYVEYLEPGLVGENPLDVDRLVEHMTQMLSNLGGTEGYAQAAVSGIETALWDLAGKLFDLPVYQLLGGKYRDEIPVYVDCHAGEHVGDARAGQVAPREKYDPAAYAAEAREVLDDGFSALKFDLDVPHGEEDVATRRLSNDAVQHKVDVVDAIREEIGDGPLLGVDLHWNFTRETASRLVSKLEPYDLAWIEDPVPPEDVDGHRQISESTTTPILTGENLTRAEGFLPFLEDGAVNVISPDIQKCGGLLEFRKIATLADAYSTPLVPHNLSSPVGTAASAHACATVPGAFALEWHAREVDWWDDLTTGDSLIDEGSVSVPEAPGLGIELDQSEVNDRLMEGEEPLDL